MHDVIIPEADYSIAATRDLRGAGGVFFLLLRVLAAVEFNRELAIGTGEIDDITSDRMLPPEAVLGRKLAQNQPHRLLGFRRSPPQSPSNPGPSLHCQAMLPTSLSARRGQRGRPRFVHCPALPPSLPLRGGEGRGEVGIAEPTAPTLPSADLVFEVGEEGAGGLQIGGV